MFNIIHAVSINVVILQLSSIRVAKTFDQETRGFILNLEGPKIARLHYPKDEKRGGM